MVENPYESPESAALPVKTSKRERLATHNRIYLLIVVIMTVIVVGFCVLGFLLDRVGLFVVASEPPRSGDRR